MENNKPVNIERAANGYILRETASRMRAMIAGEYCADQEPYVFETLDSLVTFIRDHFKEDAK